MPTLQRILLISTDVDWITDDEAVRLPFLETKAPIVPLALATIAALTPDDIEVDLWDEPVHGRIDDSTEFEKDYDLVGITAIVNHLPRAEQIAQVFRKRGVPIAIGGVGVSAAPEACRESFDILFIGEAELTWPRFIADWKAGNHRSEYRQVTKPDLAASPPPRWDSIADQIKSYAYGGVQTTRGCPFDCEFCDATYLFGRRSRHKPIDTVLQEVAALEHLGMEYIFFCDDNLIGNSRYVKELLRELIPLNNSFQTPVAFSTQLSINVAQDDELLELLADANFDTLLIGIETPNEESLKETNKLQNLRGDLLADCRKVQSYGMAIKASMIVGFDHDDTDIFDKQFEFLQEACIPFIAVHMLMAPQGTRLWDRLRREKRIVLDEGRQIYGPLQDVNTNIIPKRMTRVELFSRYLSLEENLSDWRNFEARVKGFISGIKRTPNVPQRRRPIRWKFLFGLFRYLFFFVDKEARRATFRLFRYTRKNAPFMRKTVLHIITRQYVQLVMLQKLRERLLRRIELEKSEDFKLDIDQGDILIPENFEKHYQEIFPDIHRRVYRGLTDKARTDEALIEVFAGLITRWGETLDSFSDHHKVFLHELADRAVEKENSAVTSVQQELHPPELVEGDEDFEGLPDVKRTHLAGEILKAVEQELRSMGKISHAVRAG